MESCQGLLIQRTMGSHGKSSDRTVICSVKHVIFLPHRETMGGDKEWVQKDSAGGWCGGEMMLI